MPTPTTVQARFQVRADTAANWTSANPTLLLNEIGIETDTKKLKMGDGTTAWASLAYFPSIVSGGTVLGNLEIGTTGTLTFEGSTADGFETTLAVVDPTADRTITLPDATGTVILNSGGQTIQFGAGAVGTPSITTVGDLDTGIWFPAANTTAISTAGSERLRIDSSGRLGIGTSSPAAALHVSALDGTIYQQATRGTGTTWRLQTSGANGQAYELYDITNSQRAYLYIGGAGGSWQFSTEGTERLRITSAGLVGIGTSSPGVILDIRETATGATTAISLFNTDNTNSTSQTARIGLSPDSRGAALAGLEVYKENADFSTSAARDVSLAFNVLLNNAKAEAARIDSSGRLLVGTSTAESIGGNDAALLQISSSNGIASIRRFNASSAGPILRFGKSRAATLDNTIVQSGDVLGQLSFCGADGASVNSIGAAIIAEVDGTPGANDIPGRLVLSTTLDGASSPTEQLRITNDGVRGYNQAAPVAVDATATLTVANLKNGIITSTTAAAVTGTLPTGTLTEGGFSGLYTNFTFEWTVINTGATNNFTVAAGTAHTVVGNMVVAAGNSGRFATRRTAANTFVTYRLSS